MKSYIPFGRLIRINNPENWNDIKKPGNLAFGVWDNDTADGSVYRIWANDVEYDITDPVVFQRIIDNIQSDILDISTNRLPVLLSDISVGVTSNDDTAVLQFQGVKESGSLTDITNINISGGEYVGVSVDNDNISIDLSTCTLMDAYKGQSGLAIAEDVVKQIIEDEIVTAKTFVKVVNVTGIKTDFSTNWTKDRFIDMNMTEAIESLDTSINEINGSNLIVSGDSKYADSSIAKAIADLSTAIDNAGKQVIGEDPLEETQSLKVIDDYVAVSVTKNLDRDFLLDSSVLIADFTALHPNEELDITPSENSGLATDGYVQDSVKYAFRWLVI